jgi:hypothetical protein
MPASRQGAGKMCLARRGAPQVPYAGLSEGGARLRKLLVGAGLPLPLPVGSPPALAACCWRRAWRTSARSAQPRARSWPSYVRRWEPPGWRPAVGAARLLLRALSLRAYSVVMAVWPGRSLQDR